MDFIQQACLFNKLGAENLTPNAIAIYYHLFHVNNRTGWKEWFFESDLWIGRAVGISRTETIVKAINLLKQKGFIDFERGTKRSAPTKYKLMVLNNSTCNSTCDSTKDSTCDSTKDSTCDSTKDSTCDSSNIKQETKTKTKTEDAPAKKHYAEFVTLTETEYKKLVDRFGGRADKADWCIDFLSDYKAANGKKYKSDYHAILQWVIAAYEEKRAKRIAQMKQAKPFGDDAVFENFGRIVDPKEHEGFMVGET